jgi:hypothetical protein
MLGLDGIFNDSSNVEIAIAKLAATITSKPANSKTINAKTIDAASSSINNNAFIYSNSKDYLLLRYKRLNKKKAKLEDGQALETESNKVIK